MKKFELFMCCLGNGTTVCNKAVEENGDYKMIAHISEHGKIRWYVPVQSVPADELLKIEHYADVQYAKWDNYISGMTEFQQYDYFLNRVTAKTMLEAINMDGDLWEKIQYLKGKFLEQ